MSSRLKAILSALAGFAAALSVQGATATLDQIKAPASPAFALVGITPTKIDQPGSVKAFGAALLNASAGGGSNVAFQFAPYWWGDRSRLTWKDYEKSELGDIIAQTATVSLATYSKDATASVAAYNGVALGFSCDLIRGKYSQKYQDKLDVMLHDIAKMKFGEDPTDDQLKQYKEKTLGFNPARTGPAMMFSTAVAYKYTGQLSDTKTLDRYGAWLTYSYKPSEDSGPLHNFTALASVRSIRQRSTPSDQKYTDYGGRILWHSGTYPVMASFEYMKRTGDARDETVSLAMQYQINESLYLYVSHGDALKGDGNTTAVTTLAGLSISWGDTAKVRVP